MATEISLYPPFSNRITVGRNDPCHCLSGKKFKKCCAAKKEAKNEPIAPILTFTNQPIDQHLSYDVPSKADKETLASLYCQIRNHPETIKSVNDDYFTILQELKKKYTNYPAIFNYLALGYQHLGLDEKFKELTFETHAKFPSYLFGLTAIASLYLNEQNPDKDK